MKYELLSQKPISFALLEFAGCSTCLLFLFGRSFCFRLLGSKERIINVKILYKNYYSMALILQIGLIFQLLHPCTLRFEEIDPVTVKNVSRRPWVLPCLLFVIFLQPLRIRSSLTHKLKNIRHLINCRENIAQIQEHNFHSISQYQKIH